MPSSQHEEKEGDLTLMMGANAALRGYAKDELPRLSTMQIPGDAIREINESATIREMRAHLETVKAEVEFLRFWIRENKAPAGVLDQVRAALKDGARTGSVGVRKFANDVLSCFENSSSDTSKTGE